MSILLEALRKSEKSQRSPEVPTIHSEVPASQVSRSFKLWPFVVLMVLTASVSGWFAWNQYRSPSDVDHVADTGPAASAIDENSTETGSVSAPPNGPLVSARSRKAVPGENQPLTADRSIREGNSTNPKPDSRTASHRTPVETYDVEDTEDGNEVKPVESAAKPTQQTRTFNTNNRSSSRALQADETDLTTDESSVVKEKPYRAGAPDLLGYWDLPDSVRENVPDIKFSVLVYDKNPENRFVLINGERLGEDDSYQPGLVVKEIRRDGVIFSYRLYQFLVEK